MLKDGIFVKVPRDRYSEYIAICQEGEKKTKLKLEHDQFERFYQYAINDYIGVKKGGSETHNPKLIKKKGLFIDTPILGKGLAPLIIPEALNKYYVEGIDPKETIGNCKDILKFCTFQKVDKKFEVFYGNQRVVHINRFYMSRYGKPLSKQVVDEKGNRIGSPTLLCATSPVTIYNKVDDVPIEKRALNYHGYLHECYKIIDKMDSQQLSLW